MSAIQKRTVSLPQEHAAFIDRLVKTGAYGSASEVVRAGLRALQERDAAVERWLRDEVAKTCDEIAADPDRVVLADAVQRHLRARHLERSAAEQ